jgi:hypothetical protein
MIPRTDPAFAAVAVDLASRAALGAVAVALTHESGFDGLRVAVPGVSGRDGNLSFLVSEWRTAAPPVPPHCHDLLLQRRLHHATPRRGLPIRGPGAVP